MSNGRRDGERRGEKGEMRCRNKKRKEIKRDEWRGEGDETNGKAREA